MGDGQISIPREEIDQILADTANFEFNHAILFGPYGTGKTFTALGAAKPYQPVVVVTITESMTASALIGHFLIKGGETVWLDNAPALYAWQQGALLVLNEVDKARGDVEDICHVLLDDPKVAKFKLASGQEVTPQGEFRCIATMNGELSDLPGALRDRFAIAIPVNRPTTKALESLPSDVVAAVTYKYDEAERLGKSPDITFRQMRNFAQHRAKYSDETAALMVTGDSDQAVALVELLQMLRLKAEVPTLGTRSGLE